MKKTTTHPAFTNREIWTALDGMSKSALMDVVADSLDLQYGSGEWGMEQVREFINPRLAARRDRPIR